MYLKLLNFNNKGNLPGCSQLQTFYVSPAAPIQINSQMGDMADEKFYSLQALMHRHSGVEIVSMHPGPQYWAIGFCLCRHWASWKATCFAPGCVAEKNMEWAISSINWGNEKMGQQIRRVSTGVWRQELRDSMFLKRWKLNPECAETTGNSKHWQVPAGAGAGVSAGTDTAFRRDRSPCYVPCESIRRARPCSGTCAGTRAASAPGTLLPAPQPSRSNTAPCCPGDGQFGQALHQDTARRGRRGRKAEEQMLLHLRCLIKTKNRLIGYGFHCILVLIPCWQ